MSRTIKFRAWLKIEQRMYPVVGMLFSLVMLAPSENTLGGIPVDDVELMQFTGLKDKHGCEVYEGDIVRDDRWDFTPFEVRWGAGQNEFLGGQVGWILDDARFGPVPHIVNELTAYGEVNDPHREDYYPGEVIGNIYEHPELLKASAP